MREFFTQKCFAQLFLDTFWLCNFWQKNIVKNGEHKMLMKLTPWVVANLAQVNNKISN